MSGDGTAWHSERVVLLHNLPFASTTLAPRLETALLEVADLAGHVQAPFQRAGRIRLLARRLKTLLPEDVPAP